MCALLRLMRVFAAGWAYRGRRGESLEGTVLCGVVGYMGWVEVWKWEWVLLGGGSVCLGLDSVRRAVDMVEGRGGLAGVELAQEWSRVGWVAGVWAWW